MANQTQIGLSKKDSQQLTDHLNQLLANYQVFYINARGFHWNIKGEKFFELHAKFEELYNNLLIKIDEVAERILTLGYTPLHTFTDYLEKSSVKEVKNVSDGRQAIQNIVESLRLMIQLQRSIAAAAMEAGDDGTDSLMSDYIREQEKLVWMYSAYLG